MNGCNVMTLQLHYKVRLAIERHGEIVNRELDEVVNFFHFKPIAFNLLVLSASFSGLLLLSRPWTAVHSIVLFQNSFAWEEMLRTL